MSDEKNCSVTLCEGGIWECQKAELEEKLRVAKEALENIAVHFGTDYCSGDTMIAHEALEKIKGGSDEN